MTTETVARTFASRFASTLSVADAAKVADLALRTDSAQAADVLARAASAGEFDYEQLVTRLGDQDATHDQRLATPWLLQLARVVALRRDTGIIRPDHRVALALFRHVLTAEGPRAFDAASGGLFAQVLLRSGLMAELATLLPGLPMDDAVRWAVDVDTVNPFGPAGGDQEAWEASFNQVFRPAGLEPVTVIDGSAAAFDRLSVQPDVPSTGGDLVSVIMPAFSPDRGILGAVRSILAQSWSDLELLVVDDASGREFDDVFDEVAALDERVRVIRVGRNGGTYAARNRGLAEARGTYVAFQDSDDWSHPRRLEHQVQPLLESSKLLATRSWAVRAYPDLSLTYVGYPPTRQNASSMVFRREQVLALMGRFDDVRKSADVELPSRLRAAAPKPILDLPETSMLSITQLRQGSLSRSDAVPGWTRWDRLAYRNRYLEWHNRIKVGQSSARLGPGLPRPFPLPHAGWAPERTSTRRRQVDVLYVTDWRTGQGAPHTAVGDVSTLLAAGLDVAVAHLEAPVPLAPHREHASWQLQRLLHSTGVAFVHHEQEIDADLVVVGNPGALQFRQDVPSGVRAGSVVMVAGSPVPAEHAGPELGFSVSECDANARDVFGVTPRWLPRGPEAREAIAGVVPEVVLAPDDLGRAPGGSARGVARRRLTGPPVLGHHLPDDPRWWPADAATTIAVYPDDDAFDVRFLASRRAAEALLGAAPPNWVSFERIPTATWAFLRQLDFFVYFGTAGRTDESVQAAIEAVTAGCVAVLPPSFRPDLGDAAVYASAADAPAVVRAVHADPAQYARLQRRGLDEGRDRQARFVDCLTATKGRS